MRIVVLRVQEHIRPVQCLYCVQDTAGNHHPDCPCRNLKYTSIRKKPNITDDSSNCIPLSEEEETNMFTKVTINTAFDFWDNDIDDIWNFC